MLRYNEDEKYRIAKNSVSIPRKLIPLKLAILVINEILMPRKFLALRYLHGLLFYRMFANSQLYVNCLSYVTETVYC